MWIVRLALRRPYTFVVAALLILLVGAWYTIRMPKDVFPFINIPVVSVLWSFQGMPAQEFEQRITTYSEYALSGNLNDLERIESQTTDGIGIIRLYFHPGASIESAIAQATASSQSILRRMPVGMQPPIIVRFNANTVPLIQMVLSSPTMTEQELYDYGIYRIRQFISTVQGTTLPTPYGGKVKQVMIDLDPVALQAKGLSPRDVNNAIINQNITPPTGDVRIGRYDYRLNVNNTPEKLEDLNNFPIKMVNGTPIYIRDVGFAHDGYTPQVNIVRDNGLRAILLTVLKNGSASTLDIINGVKNILATVKKAAPPDMNINLLFDQSIFVRSAILNVVIEGVAAATLTGLMMLIFLGSWRSTLIVLVSIPLSIFASIICLGLIGETLNLMTLGGLALAIGILVDDATVTVENIHRNIAMGKPLQKAILDGSYQVAIPAFVSTLAIGIVFLPVTLLVGPSRFLFVPFAEAVVFAIAASYILSRTLVPVMIKYLIKGEMHLYVPGGRDDASKLSWLDRYHIKFEEYFHHFKCYYAHALDWSLHFRGVIFILFGMLFLSAILLLPFIGRDFFPTVDAGQFRLHVSAPTGTRIEVTEEIFGEVEDAIKKVIPAGEIKQMIDNIGLPYEAYAQAFGDSSTIGGFDGEILVQLTDERSHETPYYIEQLRGYLNDNFPNLNFYFQPADMVNQILNFGLPAPIDVRVIGYNKENNLKIAYELRDRMKRIPGAADVHLHQPQDFPELFLDLNRTRLAELGLRQQDISNDILLSYGNGSVTTPNFWLDRKAGIPYLITVQTPKYRVNSIMEMLRMPVASPATSRSELLSNLGKVERRVAPAAVSHFNIQPTFDIYANVQGSDLGSVTSQIQTIVNDVSKQLTPGNIILIRGQVDNMNTAFTRLGLGFIFAIILIYCIMVINFQSWLDPFIIIMALPGALSGIVWMLFLTHTSFNVPSLMGTIMAMGVATANSILLVSFANMQLLEGDDSVHAMRVAGSTRLRPVLMTALAMIVGMIPMALGLGEGGEQNSPLGRAVIGGLILATVTTLFFVPVVFSLLRTKPNPYLKGEKESYTPPEHEKLEDDIDE